MNAPLGHYLHYKGNEYRLMAAGKIEKTGDDVAIYKAVEGEAWWVRPLKEFLDEVEVNGQRLPRFKYIGE